MVLGMVKLSVVRSTLHTSKGLSTVDEPLLLISPSYAKRARGGAGSRD